MEDLFQKAQEKEKKPNTRQKISGVTHSPLLLGSAPLRLKTTHIPLVCKELELRCISFNDEKLHSKKKRTKCGIRDCVAFLKQREHPDINDVDVNSLDDFQRTPLHYAFTSLENRNEASSTDPIQIVSFLVEAMDHKAINQRDMYGCSSLHYAAQRGSTVCALLLIQKGKIKTF